LEIAQILEDEQAVSKVLRSAARDNLAWLSDREEPGCQVGGVTDRRVVHAKVLTNGPYDYGTCIDPDPHAELDPVSALDVFGEGLEAFLNGERGNQRTLSVVFVRDRCPEQRHHTVTKELVDRTLVAVNRIKDQLEDAIHDRVDVFGIELLGHRR